MESHAYKLAFLMLFFFAEVEQLNCTADGLDIRSLKDDVDGGFLLPKEPSCCDGLSVSSAGLVLEL